MLENKQGISKITMYKKIHCFCPLGNDWYTNNLTISFQPVNEFPDYIEIEEELDKLEKQDLIIENVVAKCYDIVKQLCPTAVNIHIISEVDDAKHLAVKVEKN